MNRSHSARAGRETCHPSSSRRYAQTSPCNGSVSAEGGIVDAIMLQYTPWLDKDSPLNFIRDYVSWGAGPRASQYLVLAAKARAVLHGRYYVSTDDIRSVAGPVMRHRIITNFNAEAEGLKPDDIVERLIKSVPVDEHEAEQSGKLPKIFRSANAG